MREIASRVGVAALSSARSLPPHSRRKIFRVFFVGSYDFFFLRKRFFSFPPPTSASGRHTMRPLTYPFKSIIYLQHTILSPYSLQYRTKRLIILLQNQRRSRCHCFLVTPSSSPRRSLAKGDTGPRGTRKADFERPKTTFLRTTRGGGQSVKVEWVRLEYNQRRRYTSDFPNRPVPCFSCKR